MNNRQRGLRALKGISFEFAEEIIAGGDLPTYMEDFLTNFIHLCDSKELCFESLLQLAYMNYREHLIEEREIKKINAHSRATNKPSRKGRRSPPNDLNQPTITTGDINR